MKKRRWGTVSLEAIRQQEGEILLNDMAEWIEERIYLPRYAADAIALWSVTTWFVEDLYFAPLLAILSPTKRCGKTNVCTLLSHITRKGIPTSGDGITASVIFRLNDKERPTFIIDEADKLSGKDADKTRE